MTQVHTLKDHINKIVYALNCVYIIIRCRIVFYKSIFIVFIYAVLIWTKNLNLNEIINLKNLS
jgi:hypothetical protein